MTDTQAPDGDWPPVPDVARAHSGVVMSGAKGVQIGDGNQQINQYFTVDARLMEQVRATTHRRITGWRVLSATPENWLTIPLVGRLWRRRGGRSPVPAMS